MKLNVKNDKIIFGTNILDVKIPDQLRQRNKCGVPFIDDAFGGEGLLLQQFLYLLENLVLVKLHLC